MGGMARPVFLYDGDCAFCTTCARFVERRIPSRADLLPWQFADLTALGVTAAQAEAAVQWVGADGVVASGPDAIALLLRDAGRLWAVPGRALQARLLRAAAWPLYRWIADHRHLLPGGTAACSLPQAERDRRPGPGTPG
jgi:predicted DCC family thiol-disulfide oxidoreductase YuxK